MAPFMNARENHANGTTDNGSPSYHQPHETGDIAIIGLSCRFPQDAETTSKLWDFLLEGRSSLGPFPKERFAAESYYHPDSAHGGTTSTIGGHFLKHDCASFDPSFFGITKNEAVSMDPQQRMLLESVYGTLENAGLPLERVKGSKTSVFVGAFTDDYKTLLQTDPETKIKYKPTGVANSMLSNRMSWFYDLRGSSLTIDTACSSSLVALNLACENLKSGQANMAIVGGVNIIEDPETNARMTHLGFVSPTARCYSFDSRANGYSRGEGVGTVLIKPLDTALRDGDTIRAVIRGSGTNQDGKTPGITLPSKAAQTDLIKSVYANAGLSLSETSYIETHGTGTQAGDPIEASAIAAAFSTRRSETPLYLGSIKSNIGHLEGASGLAGLIKAILAVENGIIPGNYDFQEVNPKIQTKKWNIEIASKQIPWPTAGIRRVSINSFGFGGTNGHVIVDDAYSYLKERNLSGNHATTVPEIEAATKIASALRIKRVFVWSAFDQTGVKRQLSKYLDYFENKPTPKDEDRFLSDLAYTLSERRTLFTWRSSIVADSLNSLRDSLSGVVPGAVRSREVLKLGFVFTGQGAQWSAMGRELGVYPIFKHTLWEASESFKSLGSDWNLLDELSKDDESSNIDQPWLSQAACTALQIALVDLLASWNVSPSRVIGHSSGEIAAAYSANAITKQSAWKIAYFRGIVSSSLEKVRGSMMAVGLSVDDLQSYLENINRSSDDKLVAACINSPKNVTVSGAEEKLDYLSKLLDEDQVFCRKLKVQIPYHSGYMKLVSERYRDAMGVIESPDTYSFKKEPILMFSSVTGQLLDREVLATSRYWVDNLEQTVRFAPALSAMCSESTTTGKISFGTDKNFPVDHILEIGPHSALRSAIKETLAAEKGSGSPGYSFLLSRGHDSSETALDAVGDLYCRGYPVDLAAVNHRTVEDGLAKNALPKLCLDLPSYEFNRQRYWLESRLSRNTRFRKHPRHDLLGAPVPEWNIEQPTWRQFIRIDELPWLNDHKITGSVVYPGVGYLVMAIEACKQITEEDIKITGYRLKDVSLKAALTIPSTDAGVETIFSMQRFADTALSNSAWREFRLSSYNESTDGWTEHCSGMIYIETEIDTGPVDGGKEAAAEIQLSSEKFAQSADLCQVPVDISRYYMELETIGLTFGPLFKNLSEVKCGNGSGDAIGTIKIPDVKAAMPMNFLQPHVIHPASFDSMLHVFLAAIGDVDPGKSISEPMVPVFIKEVWLSASISNSPGHLFKGHGSATRISHAKYANNVAIWDADPTILRMTVKGMETVPVQSSSASNEERELCYNIEWRPDVDLLNSIEGQNILSQPVKQQYTRYDEDVKLMEKLQLASILYILDALEKLDQNPPSNLQPHQTKYFAWLRYQAGRYAEGLIEHQTQQWELYTQDASRKEALFSEVEKISCEGELLVRMGSQLVPIFHGTADPLQLMFGDDLLDSLYAESLGTQNIHRHFESFLEIYKHKHTNLRVLEIGAGTGGTTSVVLETLCPRLDESYTKYSSLLSYTYTDISAGFFEKAKARFNSWRNLLQFKTLNVENDVEVQGFEAGSYDLIIAANVLHATADLKTTLANVRYLLRPGGKLLLQETTSTVALTGSLCFGNLPGWWLSTEAFRDRGPLIHEKDWNQVLRETNFSGTDFVLHDTEDSRIHSQSLIVSSALTPISEIKSKPKVIVVTEAETSTEALSRHLESALQKFAVQEYSVVDISDVKPIDLKDAICIVLVEIQRPFLADIGKSAFEDVRHILTTSSKLLWVTGNTTQTPEAALIQGLIRTARWERDLDHTNLVLLSLEDIDTPIDRLASQLASIVELQFISDNEDQQNAEYRLSHELININRLVNANYVNKSIAAKTTKPTATLQAYKHDPTRALMLTTGSPGLLSELYWQDWPKFETPLKSGEIEVEIKAVGLNFLDIMVAMGEVASNLLGREGSGIVHKVGPDVDKFQVGDRVVVLGTDDSCLQTYMRSSQGFAEKIPDDMGYEMAAGVPLIFSTAYYCIYDVARVQKGETILIHAAAGGVGQAAIMLSQAVGAEIFATVSSEKKKALLMDTFGIPEDHIFSSRNLSFTKGIMRMTKNRGVDVIINSLSGELLRRTWDCIAPQGRFIELGKKDIYSNGKLDMMPFSKSVMFAGVFLDTLIKVDQKRMEHLIQVCMLLWKEGKIRQTTPYNIYNFSQIEEVFRIFQAGKHIGKLVLKANDDDLIKVVPKPQTPHQFDENASYILAGGTGGLGRSIARWMVTQGAKNIIFLSRSGSKSADASDLQKELEAKGCQVPMYVCDVSDEQQLEEVIAQCIKTLPPIRGCIQGAMQLKDSTLVNMTYDKYKAALRPKVEGSWNLHKRLPKEMDFFIMLSSVCGIIGNRGQANYAAGNTYQDALAHYRISQGLPAVSLDLGNILSVGFVAENWQTVNKNTIFAVAQAAIREDEFLSIIQYHVDPRNSTRSELHCQVATGLPTSVSYARQGIAEQSFMRDPLFTQLRLMAGNVAGSSDENSSFAIQSLLRSAETKKNATDIVVESILKRLSSTMSIPPEDVSPQMPVHHYGVDSLVAMEFRNWFAKDMAADIPVLEIMGPGSIVSLSENIVSISKMVRAEALTNGDAQAEGT